MYLFERKKTQAGGGAEGEGEAGSPLGREPDMGLDPRTLGSPPEQKSDTSLTEPPRHPNVAVFR